MTYNPPPFPYIAPKVEGQRHSTEVGTALMGAMHCAYRGGLTDDVIKDLWLSGMEAYRLACLMDANEGVAQRVRPGMDWKQATQNFHGMVAKACLDKLQKFLMICEAMLPEDSK